MSTSRKLQLYITLTVFLSMNFTVFNPLLKCALPITGHFFCLITATVCTCFICFVFSKSDCLGIKSSILSKIFSILCAITAVFSVLLLMTQVIRDTCFIVGNGVSTVYYFILSLCLLSASFILSSKGKRGILSFCCISAVAIVLFTLLCFLPFSTVRGINTDFFGINDGNGLFQSVLCGVISGMLLSFDCAVFFYCSKRSGVHTKITVLAVITAFFLLLCRNGCVYLILGKSLTLLLSKPVYALTKCFKGFDLTEIVPAVGIFTFITKCSVYLYSASSAVKEAFFPSSSKASKIVLSVIFLCVPAIYLPFLFLGEKYPYGSLQHLIYPAVPVMSLLFLILHIFEKKR